MDTSLVPLPIDEVLPDIVDRTRRDGNVTLLAPTGAGKTTRVPPALLDAGLAGDKLVVMLQPRRLAAMTAARRMADERGESVGQSVGYQVRFDRQASEATQILVVTEGVFLRMLIDDPLLERVGIVIFDEFHERRLDSDLALAITRRLQTEFRDDLHLVVMSATFDPEPIARFLTCGVVRVDGRTYPVDIAHALPPARTSIAESALFGIEQLWDRTDGDLLVFLPGVGEIRQTGRRLRERAASWNADLFELYADLPTAAQQQVFARSTRRKIVLSTNVAETSVTIEGVTGVVDTGWARVPSFDSRVGLNRLDLRRISRASADQRAGRAGRTQPGVCVRLWSEAQRRHLLDHEPPEVVRLDLSSALLRLLAWGESDFAAFPWFESPPAHALERAARLLFDLGAMDKGQLTTLGRRMARLPADPRIARLLMEAERRGCLPRASIAAALLSERNPFQREEQIVERAPHTDSDLLDRVEAIERFDARGDTSTPYGRLDRLAAKSLLRAASQFEQIASRRGVKQRGKSATLAPNDTPCAALSRTLLTAFPDRVARRREPRSRRGLMVGGRGVELASSSGVLDGELFLCIDVAESRGVEAFVRTASAVELDWLDPRLITTNDDVDFDEQRERVRVLRRRRYLDLVIDERTTSDSTSAATARVLYERACASLDRVLPRDDVAWDQFLARVRCLRGWMPELNLPLFDREQLAELLETLCKGRRSFAELQKAPWLDHVKGCLTYEQLATLEREAPERVATPRGNRIRLHYEVGSPPVMSVRIQEVFGLMRTPRVAAGRVAVLMELLGPNYRPQQRTDDLPSFWANTYPVIRKELRRRYPKHAWPEDPQAT